MGKFSVSRSLTIGASVGEVFGLVRDFEVWPDWSPWLILESGCVVDYDADGKGYSWVGELVGSGSMRLSGESEGEWLMMDLEFLKPWKSQAKVRFDFREKDGGVEVVWSMESALPWFMFWMKGMMVRMIGMDYERGLRMLKDLAENGEVASRMEVVGEADVPACDYVGLGGECSFDGIAESMGSDFQRLGEMVEREGIGGEGSAFTVCESWKMGKGVMGYTIGIPVRSEVLSVPEGFQLGRREACRAFVVRHTGAYEHLGNAWSAGMVRARSKVFRGSRKMKPFEVYEVGPDDGGEKGSVTLVCFPVK